MDKFQVKNQSSLAIRLIAAFIVFLFTLLCAVSLLVPAPKLHFEKYVPQNDDLIAKISTDEIAYLNSCDISANGEVTVTGDDAHIVFAGFEKPIQTIQMNFKEASLNEFYATLYYDNGKEFNETNSTRKFVVKGDTEVCFKIPSTINKSIRVDIDADYTINSIELHSKEPDVVETKLPVSAKRYVLAFVISVLVSICAFFVDKYIFPFSQKILNYYKKNCNGILVALLLMLAGVVISVGIEYLLGRFVFGISSMGTYFNMYRYFFIVCVIWAITLLICYIKSKNQSPERVFAFLMLLVGISMILCAPFGHICWDFDSHSKYILEMSYIGDAYKTSADDSIFSIEEFHLSKETASDNINNIRYINSNGYKIVSLHSSRTTIAHIPAAISMAIGRFLGLPYVTYTNFARFTNLIAYILICYLAMKKLKSGKMILATIAFFPTNLFLATNYSYDFWVTAFIMYGVAYFISEIQQPFKTISALDTVLMCGAFILACTPKQIYMPIMVLPFFMYKKWKSISAKRRYYLICILMFALMFVMLLIRSKRSISGGGDTRGGSDVNSPEQLNFILSQPIQYAKILLNFLKNYLSIGNMKDYITNFAYMKSGNLAWIFIVMLVVTSLTDKCINDCFNGLVMVRIINVLLFFGVACLVATSMYVIFTAVGSQSIQGCQGRYLTPMLFPLLVTVANPGINFNVNKKMYNVLSLTILSSVVFYNVGYSLLSCLM